MPEKVKVIVYGLGQGFEGILNFCNDKYMDFVGCIDRNAKTSKYARRFPILELEELAKTEFDYVLICSRNYQHEMAETLLQTNVSPEKIVVAPNCITIDRTYQNLPAIERMFDAEVLPVHTTMGPELPFQNCEDTDYVRKLTLARAAKILHNYNVDGACAELGVYRGDFARLINEAFPESELYLFDTFEGFDERDISADPKFDLKLSSSFELNEKLKDTDVQIVLNKMPFPEKCVIKKGYFPDTTEGMPEDIQFSLVSIDADLYTPILEGLEYFYPRMKRGGMIFVHDYITTVIGAGYAVDEFAKKNSIIPIPVGDEFNSVIIVRQ